jgi:glutaminyl-tRNA synthetase
VSAGHALPAEVRLYDRLFTVANPDDAPEGKTFKEYLNPDSLAVLHGCLIEPSVANDPPGARYQFERLGYFIADAEDSRPGAPVYNRIVTLRDSWAKAAAQPATVAPAPQPAKPTPAQAAGQEQAEATRHSRTEARDEARAAAPELAARLARYTQELGLPFEDADVLTGDLALARFFEAALAEHGQPQSVAKWVTNELLRELKGRSPDQLPFSAAQFGRLVALVDDGTLSATLGKQVFDELLAQGGEPEAIVRERGLAQISDRAALAAVVARVVAANPDKAAQYRSGKVGLLGFFMGQVMRETQGKANPQMVQELVQDSLTPHPQS